jgi:carbonic anhydrase/acetyltransferase-like protein (isoleucine patch superfamily)
MPIYALDQLEPDIHPDAYVHPDAVIIGSVTIGAFSSVWPGAVLRGDDGSITVGDRTSIQDGSVIHTTAVAPTKIGSGCVIGHMVHLEGCLIEDGALIGNGSVVLILARVGMGAIVGSNAVVTQRMHVPPGALAVGVPATVREGAANSDHIAMAAQSYVDRVARYKAGLRLIT